MRTLEREGESDDATLVGSEGFASRHDCSFTDAVVRSRVREDGRWFHGAGPTVRIDADIILPCHLAPAREEEHVLVFGEVLDAEFFVGHGEVSRFEALDVRHPGALDMAGAPACVDEFPLAVVDADGVPGVAGVVGWEGSTGSERGVAKALAVATDDDAFKAGVGGEGGKEGGVAFADC